MIGTQMADTDGLTGEENGNEEKHPVHMAFNRILHNIGTAGAGRGRSGGDRGGHH